MAKYKPTPKDELLGDIESEFDSFKKEVEELDKRTKDKGELPFNVPILTRSSDKHGQSKQVRFTVPKWMEGYATSLMQVFPQAKTPTDIWRAEFYVGIRLLDYVARENKDKKLELYRVLARRIEADAFDLDKIEYIYEHLSFLKNRHKKGILSLKHYINRRDELLNSLENFIETDIGKDALGEVKEHIIEYDEASPIKRSTSESDWTWYYDNMLLR